MVVIDDALHARAIEIATKKLFDKLSSRLISRKRYTDNFLAMKSLIHDHSDKESYYCCYWNEEGECQCVRELDRVIDQALDAIVRSDFRVLRFSLAFGTDSGTIDHLLKYLPRLELMWKFTEPYYLTLEGRIVVLSRDGAYENFAFRPLGCDELFYVISQLKTATSTVNEYIDREEKE
jgi:hypothetical protein